MMCGHVYFPVPRPMPGMRTVQRTQIVWKRMHSFAAERYADARTPSALRFWEDIMHRCVTEEWVYERENLNVHGIRSRR